MAALVSTRHRELSLRYGASGWPEGQCLQNTSKIDIHFSSTWAGLGRALRWRMLIVFYFGSIGKWAYGSALPTVVLPVKGLTDCPAAFI